MAENTMKLEVITPERSFYTGDVTFVELNTTEGEVGIYARHIPMTMIIAPGVLTITEEDGTKKKAALLKGFVEVTETTMSILAEVAEWPEDIDVEELNITPETLEKLLRVDKDAWKHEIQDIENFYSKFEQLPKELTDSLEELKQGIDKL